MSAWYRLALALPLVLLLAGCAQDSSPAPPEEQPGAVTPASSPITVADRCLRDVPAKLRTFPAPDHKSELVGTVLGSGPDVAVFLHQTDGDGLCGWVPYANWAADHGVRAILIDACGYGDSECSERLETDAAQWLTLPIAWARDHGAERVTVVGASMGGTVAAGAAEPAGADAIVNLSGPSAWPGVPDVLAAGRKTTVPLLVAAADTDRDIDTESLRKSVRLSPSRFKEYVAWPGGHGWDMVSNADYSGDVDPLDIKPTRLGKLVLAWIIGDYATRADPR